MTEYSGVDIRLRRDEWSAAHCSVAAALDLVGTRSAMLILREAFHGTRRFDDFVRRVGITEAIAATRLRELVEHGILYKRAYREEGQRGRSEYRLTEKGKDLRPVLIALMQWGDRWVSDPPGGPISLRHEGCGAPISVSVRCAAGHDVGPRETAVIPGPAAQRAV